MAQQIRLYRVKIAERAPETEETIAREGRGAVLIANLEAEKVELDKEIDENELELKKLLEMIDK